jgi:hypothetical protein
MKTSEVYVHTDARDRILPMEFQKNSCSRASFGSLMHKVKEGTFLEFLKAFPGLFAALLRLQHIFVCEFWDNSKN